MKNNVTIRRAYLQDMPYFYEICLKTGHNGEDASPFFYDPYLIGQYFAAPYLAYPAGVCFAAEENARPQGYIIAAPDTAAFNKWLDDFWLPPFRERYKIEPQARSEEEKNIINLLKNPVPQDSEKLLEDYPAHLHLDILPALQGKGLGRALIETMCAALSAQGVRGVHLGVSRLNERAISFYKAVGFKKLRDNPWGLTMGREI